MTRAQFKIISESSNLNEVVSENRYQHRARKLPFEIQIRDVEESRKVGYFFQKSTNFPTFPLISSYVYLIFCVFVFQRRALSCTARPVRAIDDGKARSVYGKTGAIPSHRCLTPKSSLSLGSDCILQCDAQLRP